MFETELLRVFITVAECGGFTRASEVLHSTQSTVSAQIRRLEDQAGQALFARSTRSVQLTPAGDTLLGYARTILRINEDARQRLSGAVPAGRIRLGSSEDLTGAWLPRLLRRFVTQFPQVAIDLEIGIGPRLLRRLDKGEIDVMVAGRCAGDTEGWRLWREPLVWAFARESEPPTPLRLAFFPEPCPYREAALRALGGQGEANQGWTIACTSDSLAGVRAAAVAAIAITPLPRSLVGPELRILGPEAASLPSLPDVEYIAKVGRRANTSAIATLMEMIHTAPAPMAG
ncbi:LysR family transcriptional regulator [Mesorhizobium dulcispinae]|uniref:LysR family transcriptional regulator n=1 Tax=Mesorhizobium dulcispinae TaxID=3072316 RepID=UPI002A2496C5|nr:LysR substrate-binding domain-containing protein [Mesorhizobium sp. VK23D]MDX8521651.1 LysR substrate-binding domain-containing protein [Mesorhizobium sp. VK23D]